MRASTRLLAAAALCALSLGLPWRSSLASLGYMTPGMVVSTPQTSWISGDVTYLSTYHPGYFVQGDPMRAARGAQSDERVVLAPAVAVFAWAALTRHAAARRAVAIAAVALVVVAIRGLARGYQAGPIAAMAAVVLVAPLLGWSRSLLASGRGPRSLLTRARTGQA